MSKNDEKTDITSDQVENQTENQVDDQVMEQEELSKEEQLQEELKLEKDKFLRLFAEFENYKRRTAKERIELFKTASQDVMLSLLPILDDFDRAYSEISKTKKKNF